MYFKNILRESKYTIKNIATFLWIVVTNFLWHFLAFSNRYFLANLSWNTITSLFGNLITFCFRHILTHFMRNLCTNFSCYHSTFFFWNRVALIIQNFLKGVIHRPSILHSGQVIRQSMGPLGIQFTYPQLSETGLT